MINSPYLSLDSSKLTLFCLARLYDECMSSTWRARVSFSSFFDANCVFNVDTSASNSDVLATAIENKTE